ncbi:rod shape-determining protein MreC [Candidatus Parcubacteria bacterium]|nr:rod shape-determining protein MreC [Candidatus Parcubacteria bacterium]
MKTNFRRRSDPGLAGRKRLTLVASVLALAIIVFVLLRSYIVTAVSPVWRAENVFSTTLRNTIDLVRSKDALIRENELLKQELSSYETLLLSYRTLEGGRDEVLSRYGRDESVAGVAAGVLVHPPETPYDILVVDAGEGEGVRVGQRASLPLGGALGLVRETMSHESKVALYSGSGEETQAVLERGGVQVTLVGKGGGTFKLDLPREITVEPGDKVLTLGLRPELMGVVQAVDVEPTDSAKHVLVRGVANVGSVRFVTIRP